jgi:hypothetical protein
VSGECKLLNNLNIQKYRNSKNLKIFGLFSIILSDPFSPGWRGSSNLLHMTRATWRIFSPDLRATRTKEGKGGFSLSLLVPVEQPGLKPFFPLVCAPICRIKFPPSFFFETEAKICLNLLIKKKRIAQLINGKPCKNRHNKTTHRLLTKHETPDPLGIPIESPLQPETLNTKDQHNTKDHPLKAPWTRKQEKLRAYPLSSCMRFSYDSTLFVFAPECLLLPHASPRAITHLFAFALDWCPR